MISGGMASHPLWILYDEQISKNTADCASEKKKEGSIFSP